MLPQLSGFIDQFNNLVSQSDINVITDSEGNMSIDVPGNMSSTQAANVTKRLGIIDRLINHHGSSINDLFQKGMSLEEKIKIDNPGYKTQLTDKISEFKRLNESYNH
jgi:hypothetical protein